jgi:hypothetical protein
VVYQVEQAARCGDHDVGAAAQVHHLRVDGDAAEYDSDLDALRQKFRKADDGLADLRGQLTRGHQDERAHRPVLAGAAVVASCCSSGSENAAVLPEPVWAEPTTSRPSRMAGMAADWMGWGRYSLFPPGRALAAAAARAKSPVRKMAWSGCGGG